MTTLQLCLVIGIPILLSYGLVRVLIILAEGIVADIGEVRADVKRLLAANNGE